MRYLPILVLAGLAVGMTLEPFSCFPRMSSQLNVRAFEQPMPELPEGLVPFLEPAAFPDSRQQAARLTNPVKPTPQALDLGRIYYGYYCAMCHGPRGDGDGAVGQSYVPKPTDLRRAQTQAMPDGEIAFAMVRGVGHEGPGGEPVLSATVAPARRWYIVRHLRALGRR